MLRTAWLSSLVLAALLALLVPGPVAAQVVYAAPPAVACYNPPVAYAPAPAVSYYAPPATSYYYTPAVSYYAAPAVSYYAPAVSYYAPATAVTTTRYGLFGRPRYTVTRYYP